ncbi:MAG TPA: TRAP transporter substrate-binding protein [Microvirga sp.]|jgi:TRAP-type C4-dicarboxylate transport system substrate-binding protein|nr:TRAP transporter substrate-binding protein [Microvirga sp.]
MMWKTGTVAGLIAALWLGASGAAAQTKLTFNKWLPSNNAFHADVIEPWAKAVEQATEGRVKIEFTASSLGPPPRQYDLVRSGAVDLVFSSIGYTPDRFPVSNMTSMPFLGESSEAVSVTFWDVYQRHLEKAGEFRGVRLLGAVAGAPGQIFTAKPVRAIADYKGMKLRSADALLSQAISSLGAVPVFGPAPQSYEMLSTGVIEGGGYFFDAVLAFDIGRLAPHVALVPGGFINGTFYIVMNEAKWRQLSEADRKAIESVSGLAFAKAAGARLDELEVKAKQKLLEQGLKIVEPDAAFVSEMRRLMEPIEASYLKDAQGKGVDVPVALRELREGARSYKRGT